MAISTKPYLVRALHEWCTDNGYTPHLLVVVNQQTRVPAAYVKDGEIVLNVNYSATKDLHISDDGVTFSARFGGVSQNIYVPMAAVRGLFARENGQGMFFEIENTQESMQKSKKNEEKPSEIKKPTLTIVK